MKINNLGEFKEIIKNKEIFYTKRLKKILRYEPLRRNGYYSVGVLRISDNGIERWENIYKCVKLHTLFTLNECTIFTTKPKKGDTKMTKNEKAILQEAMEICKKELSIRTKDEEREDFKNAHKGLHNIVNFYK